MVFSSVIFLCVFLPIMLLGYYIFPTKLRNLFLLCGSLFFYAWGEPVYVWLMLISIVGNYLFGLLIHVIVLRADGKKLLYAKICLGVSVLFNLGILGYFKYYDFAIETVNKILQMSITLKSIALPIGISFYTFQGMSYVIDVYREEGIRNDDGEYQTIVQKNPLNLALYIAMFPQLIAGPIVRYKDIRASLSSRITNSEDVSEGIRRFIIGLSKKAILANGLGEAADAIFTCDFTMMGIPVAWFGAFAYTLQIYYDFSGYSDMAIGLGRIFGFYFMENFNYPYISKSLTEFWRRWHISLSSWFRDYVYIPLGGSRTGNVYLNLFVVFLATGIWHGASMGFLVWGLWHGLFVLLEHFFKQHSFHIKIPNIVRWIYCMLVVSLGFVVFKLVSISGSIAYLKVMFGITRNEFVAYGLPYYCNRKVLLLFFISIAAVVPWKRRLPQLLEKVILLALLVMSLVCIINGSYNPFIYFRF